MGPVAMHEEEVEEEEDRKRSGEEELEGRISLPLLQRLKRGDTIPNAPARKQHIVWPRRVSVVVVADCCRQAGDFRVLVFLIVGFPGSSTAIALKTL